MSKTNAFTLYWQFVKMSRVSLKYIIAGTITAILGSVASVYLPRISGFIIDKAILPKDKLALLYYGAMLVGWFIITIVMDFVKSIVVQKEAESFIVRTKVSILRCLMGPTKHASASRDTGYLLERIERDAEQLRSLLPLTIISTIIMVIQGIAVLCILLSIHWVLMLICVPFLLAAGIIGKTSNRSVSHYSHEIQEAYAEKNSIIHDILQGRLLIRMAGTEDKEVSNFDNSLQKCLKTLMKSLVFRIKVNSLGKCIFILPVYGILIVGGLLVISHSVTLGALITVQLYYNQLSSLLSQILNANFTLVSSFVSLRRIEDLIGDLQYDLPPDSENAQLCHRSKLEKRIYEQPLVEFRDVCFGYNGSPPRLKGVSFQIYQNTKIAVVGPSGVGKSTTIRLLIKEVSAQSGDILFDGIPIENIHRAELYQRIGYLPPDVFLFNRSLRSNLLYRSQREYSDIQLLDMLDKLGLEGINAQVLDQLPMDMQRHGCRLSSGELQRLCLLREILADPDIIVWDEAGTSLDSVSEAKVFDCLGHIWPGGTMLFVSHRLSTIQKADQILVLSDGGTIFVGTSHTELMKESPHYRKLIQDQVVLDT